MKIYRCKHCDYASDVIEHITYAHRNAEIEIVEVDLTTGKRKEIKIKRFF